MKDRIVLFDYIKFPLTVFVIFCHWRGPAEYPITSVLDYILQPIGGILSVPIFFLFSGYFYFKGFSCTAYPKKCISRFHSVLIPYLLWNILYIVFKSACLRVNIIDFWAENGYWRAFWGQEPFGFPALFPFWYVRDLIVLFIIAPIIYYIVKYLKFWGIVVLFILQCIWEFFPGIIILKPISLFFFALGGLFSQSTHSFSEIIHKCSKSAYIILIPLMLIYYQIFNFNGYIYISRLFPCALVLAFLDLSFNVQGKIPEIFKKLSNASFFVYGAHYFIIPYCYKLYSLSDSVIVNTVIFLIIPLIIYLFFYGIYALMNRYAHCVLALFTGGR